MIPSDQHVEFAEESDSMATVADRMLMKSLGSPELYSQIPLKRDSGEVRYVVTDMGLGCGLPEVFPAHQLLIWRCPANICPSNTAVVKNYKHGSQRRVYLVAGDDTR